MFYILWSFIFQVSIQPLRDAFKMDCINVTLKSMSGLSSVHLEPNIFEKMTVNFFFQLFEIVFYGLQFYKDRMEAS